MVQRFQNEAPILANESSLKNKKIIYSNSYSKWDQLTGSKNVISSNLVEEMNFVDLLNKARKEKGMSWIC